MEATLTTSTASEETEREINALLGTVRSIIERTGGTHAPDAESMLSGLCIGSLSGPCLIRSWGQERQAWLVPGWAVSSSA